MKVGTALLLATLALVTCKRNVPTTDTASPDTRIGPESQTVTVSVKFSGLVTHLLGDYQRAVVVYTDPDVDDPHPHLVTIRPAPEGADGKIVTNLDGQCLSDSCSFEVRYMSMQLLNSDGSALTTPLRSSDGTFDRRVTNLYEVNPTAFAYDTLASEVTGDVADGSEISWGYFDLRGGDASTTKHPCPAKVIPGSTSFTEFNRDTTVTYQLAGGAILRVTNAAKQAIDIPLPGLNVSVEVDNNVKSNLSHFHEFGKLSTASGLRLPAVDLDLSVEACKPDKIKEFGGVPGCHDTKIVESSGGA